MIRIVADNYVREDARSHFLELAAELADATRTEAGNLSYFLHEDKEDPLHLTFIEEWEDEDAIECHNSSEHFTRLVPQMAECASKPGTCYLYDVLL